MSKVIGVILLVVGVFLLIRGHDMSKAINSQVKNLVMGQPTDKVTYYYLSGAICTGIGLVGLFSPFKK